MWEVTQQEEAVRRSNVSRWGLGGVYRTRTRIFLEIMRRARRGLNIFIIGLLVPVRSLKI